MGKRASPGMRAALYRPEQEMETSTWGFWGHIERPSSAQTPRDVHPNPPAAHYIPGAFNKLFNELPGRPSGVWRGDVGMGNAFDF